MITIELPILSRKQKQILLFFYKFRYPTISQLMKLLNHKSHTRIVKWLDQLVEKGCLEKHFDRRFNPEPGLFHLTTLGRAVLRKMDGVNRKSLYILNREHGKSKKFISHTRFIADVYIRYLELAGDDTLHFSSKIEMEQDEFLPEHKPDAYIAIEHKGQVVKRYFLEVFDEGTPKKAVKARVEEYLRYADEGDWETVTKHPFPQMLFICPTLPMKRYLYRLLAAILHNPNNYYEVDFFLSTKDSVKYHGVGKEIWQKVE